jgi:PAS domain S-box-containing protein
MPPNPVHALDQPWRWFGALFEAALDAILVADDRTRLVDANPAACALLGYSRAELLALTLPEVIAKSPDELAEDWRHLLRAGTMSGEYEVRCKDGTARVIEFRAVANFVPGLHVSSMRDVTARTRADAELRRQKELLQTIVDHIPVMLNFLDAGARVRWINNECERVLGWSLEEAQTMDLFASAYPDLASRQEVLDYLRAAPPGWRDFRTRRKDGFVVEIAWASVLLSDGTAIGIGQDVTGRKRVEEELRASGEQLRRLSARVEHAVEHERTELARELHDQLGQSLTALKMDLAWIHQRLEGPHRDAALLAEKTVAMSAAVDGIIREVRRISAGLRPIALDRLGLLEAIEWQADEFERRTGVRCRFDSNTAAVDLESDQATQIFRIVQEALTNTTRHAHATRATIVARKRRDRFVVEIRDNGRGITNDALADPSALGLAGMRERALLAGGELTIGRSGRKGTVVQVTVPLSRVGKAGAEAVGED